MSLAPGTRLGPYEIQSAIGEGGMGEVYSATDTRLDRTVAIKVLPAELAPDPDPSAGSGSSRATSRDDRRERFVREAKAIAALNHPHICTLHDVGHEAPANASQPAIDFLVMERLEGESLQDRLARGALPVDQSLQIAIQMADALDKAHRTGITHRDLKPGNIFLVGSGSARHGSPHAKLLDFGLAKLTDPVRSAGLQPGDSTRLADSLTARGTILGTFHYMAPEQLEGREADARSDIWALGCVLYEMVTGQKAFDGASQASLIHAIIGVEPRPIADIQPVAPRSLDHVLQRCLAKNPDDRWQTARDVHQELRWVVDQPSVEPETTRVLSSGTGWRHVAAAAATSVIAGAALTVLVLRLTTEPPAPARVTRLDVSRTSDITANPTQPQLAISSDGRTLAFSGRPFDEPDNRIFVRSLDALEATALPGTGGFGPVFSPDGTWLAYRTVNELFKVAADGGARPVSLARLDSVFVSYGLSWGENDWIYYAENVGQVADGGLFRVRASGGEPEKLLATGGATLGWPQVIGDGRFVLFSQNAEGTFTWDSAQIKVLDTHTGESRVLVESGGVSAKVTTSGHLLFVRNGRLHAVPFDRDRAVATGSPREVLDGVQYEPSSGTTQWAIADNGTLVYMRGGIDLHLLWADARGARRAFPEGQVYYDPRLSPDGRAVAVEVLGEGDDIWVLDLGRGTQTKLSMGATEDETPAWSPDGVWVAWSTNRGDQRVILRKRADGSGPEETLWSGSEHAHVSMYVPDGRSLLIEKQTVETRSDVWLLPLDGSGNERILVGSPFNEFNARLSPDGRWLAYSSDESGLSQVYVRPFPDLDARFQISPSGGNEAVWSRDGRRLFYRGDSAIRAVSVGPGQTFDPGIPERLVDSPYSNKAFSHTGYDVDRDGRFLVLGQDSRSTEALTVVLNWYEELKARVPVD